MRAWIIIAVLTSCVAHAAPAEKDAVALAEKGAQLHLAMRDSKCITVAHPTTALIGKNLLDVPDADGKLFRREMLALAHGAGHGWVDYKFRNPETGKVEAKRTYVLPVGDVALEAGIYKR
jgi:signal transduction histidine kinase